MRLRDPDDNGRRVKRQNKPIQPKRADKSRPADTDRRETRRSDRNESVRGDEAKIHGHRYRRRAEALDRDTEGTESNPSGAREQVRRAGSSSRSNTDGAPRFGSADAAERASASNDNNYRGDEIRHYRPNADPSVDSDPDNEQTSGTAGPSVDYAAYYADESEDSEESGDSTSSNPESNFRGDEVRRYGRNVDPLRNPSDNQDSDSTSPVSNNPDSNFRGSEVRKYGRNLDPAHQPSNSDERTGFDALRHVSPDAAERAATRDNVERQFVDNPLEEEQQVELDRPAEFTPGSEIPQVPELREPTSSKPAPAGMGRGTVETFDVHGVTYTRTTLENGEVTTSYEQGGTSYRDVRNDGVPVSASATAYNDQTGTSYSRDMQYDSEGNLATDRAESTRVSSDPRSTQSEVETRYPDGRVELNESTERPDGGTTNRTRTSHFDGRVEESYRYENPEANENSTRSTTTAADGTSETTTNRTYLSEQSIEDFNVEVPPVPDGVQGVVPFPSGGPSPTSVTETEVTTTGPGGQNPRVEYSELLLSQTSSDVEILQTGQDQADREGLFGDVVAPGVGEIPGEASVTRTVSVVESRNSEGDLVPTTTAGQSVTIAGERAGEGGRVSVTRGETWNSSGESSSTWATSGFTRDEQLSSVTFNLPGYGDAVKVGGETVELSPPDGVWKQPAEHLDVKGQTTAEFFYQDENAPFDSTVTVHRDKDGNEVGETMTVSQLDENGNGRTVERNQTSEAVAWSYTNYEDDGQDFQKQTVIEGTGVSIYQEYDGSRDGTFQASSRTTDAGTVISESSSSRQEVTEATLAEYRARGRITSQEYERLRSSGSPYYSTESEETNYEWLDEDGSPRVDGEGNPVQLPSSNNSWSVGGEDGYAVGESEQEDTEGGARLRYAADPGRDPSFEGTLAVLDRGTRGALRDVEQVQLSIDPRGRMEADFGDGDAIAVDPSDSDLERLRSVNPITTGLSLAGIALDRASATAAPDSSASDRVSALKNARGVLNLAYGSYVAVDGILEQDYVRAAGGAARAVSGYATYAAIWKDEALEGTLRGRFGSKLLGAGGGIVTAAQGIASYDSQATDHDRAASVATTASGVLAVVTPFAGPFAPLTGALSLGLGLASPFIAAGDDATTTVEVDERLLSSS